MAHRPAGKCDGQQCQRPAATSATPAAQALRLRRWRDRHRLTSHFGTELTSLGTPTRLSLGFGPQSGRPTCDEALPIRIPPWGVFHERDRHCILDSLVTVAEPDFEHRDDAVRERRVACVEGFDSEVPDSRDEEMEQQFVIVVVEVFLKVGLVSGTVATKCRTNVCSFIVTRNNAGSEATALVCPRTTSGTEWPAASTERSAAGPSERRSRPADLALEAAR